MALVSKNILLKILEETYKDKEYIDLGEVAELAEEAKIRNNCRIILDESVRNIEEEMEEIETVELLEKYGKYLKQEFDKCIDEIVIDVKDTYF